MIGNRVLIYFFYDRDGIIDKYIDYQLLDLKKNVREIIFVSNGELQKDSKERILKIVDKVLERENSGFDVWAYKAGIEYLGWDKLKQVEELILMNFTMYGPLYPFKEMFDKMDRNEEVDFWGITKHHGFDFDPFGTIEYGYIPEHIQSSFIAIRNNMLNSSEFKDYWNNMPSVNSYGEAVGKHEAIFTKKFNELGYKSEVYIKTDDLKEFTHYPLMIMPLELVKNRRCPVFKRKSFSNEYYEFLNCTLGEPTIELIDFIKNNLDYDLDLVWDNLLRVENMSDLKNRMHLNVILPKYYENNPSLKIEKSKVAIMMHIFNEDLIDECLYYLRNVPKEIDIYISTDTELKEKSIKEKMKDCHSIFKTVLVENRGRDVSALLVGFSAYVKNYEYVCFCHDKKTNQFSPYTIGKSFSYKCFENILASEKYIKNIIEYFRCNNRAGILMPPPPNHAAFYGITGTEWGDNFHNTLALARELNINVNMDIMKEPISPLGTMFWFRTAALQKLLDYEWKFDYFPKEPNANDGTVLHAIERLYGFASQDRGYYNAWVMNDQFSAIELTNYHFMLRELSMSVYTTIGHQMGFNLANYNLLTQLSLRKVIKLKVKKRIPYKLWRLLSRTYRAIGGKKWLD
ncbi:rhamnan synthesis protein F [Clostridiales bacterium COT073_COT-073]|nr:rhamnan synthesis protein F [Clostridiales bacterium COT073_COT-073]